MLFPNLKSGERAENSTAFSLTKTISRIPIVFFLQLLAFHPTPPPPLFAKLSSRRISFRTDECWIVLGKFAAIKFFFQLLPSLFFSFFAFLTRSFVFFHSVTLRLNLFSYMKFLCFNLFLFFHSCRQPGKNNLDLDVEFCHGVLNAFSASFTENYFSSLKEFFLEFFLGYAFLWFILSWRHSHPQINLISIHSIKRGKYT